MTNSPTPSPTPELVEQWRNLPEYVSQLRTMSTVTITTEKLQDIATQAARWGADQELKACCVLMDEWGLDGEDLVECRRPKPPSLKEQALAELEILSDYAHGLGCSESAIRRALEQLDD